MYIYMGEVERQVQFQQVETELQHLALKKRKRCLSKQQSMFEAPRDIAWERKRRQEGKTRTRTRTRRNSFHDNVTDDDLHELKGCIELGFGFNEENGQKLCNTLPALDLYFAVNRQLSSVSTPHSRPSSSFGSPVSSAPPPDSDSWKICSPGDDPEHVKTKLRHWAQAVACSLMQSH
ncbi:hypothetical protein AAZX31_03G227000 [Glycine max]|uniref:Uncharacterized protein n=3 Tax=Glycine subgen. Soja TaxID=1462606 RepID=I1JRN6_SOYBN|nr:uncharacterized protein LOC102667203 [Glycine max]XP_028226702.1 uncharacterized protein LOC114407706 [Glycine soja]KRH68742.1 hypothetical protein GLYMA_03G247700v4 [Glycine max]KRH68744.1 hypothetical protein GLYMA_03G247700v4 [Glycine max]RZC22358.1 hypothetical protein D0Y65_008156 [Glycine soja]|eukprot:XP_006577746.2 uncharacterized protein LOC102667203 [Glycine max]